MLGWMLGVDFVLCVEGSTMIEEAKGGRWDGKSLGTCLIYFLEIWEREEGLRWCDGW